MTKPVGRPSIYSAKLAATLCLRLAEGESLRKMALILMQAKE